MEQFELEFNTDLVRVELKPHNKITYEEAKQQIALYNRTAIVQPTATGKSYILMQFLQDYYKELKVVIGTSRGALNELVKKPEWVNHNTIVWTYSNIHNLVKQLKNLKDCHGITVGLIVWDELHKLGTKVWGKNSMELEELFPDATVIGFTATPIRYLDSNKDTVKEYFNGISAGNMTLQQAIEEGILPCPVYKLAMLDITQDIKARLAKIDKKYKTSKGQTKLQLEEAKEILTKYQANWERDEKIIEIIRDGIGHYNNKNYKHIVFTPSIAMANMMEPIIKSWFESVFPINKVNVYMVHSGNEFKDSELYEFCSVQDNTDIDVVISVNMVNDSFHIKNTKSVMMLRYTSSPNLYLQQIGRALEADGEDPVIFDFVGNIESVGNIVDFLTTLESKVTNVLKDDIQEIIRHNAAKIFKEYTDDTGGFRGVLSKADKLISDNWEIMMDEVEQIYKEGNWLSLTDIQLEWFRVQQKKFLAGTLSDEKSKQIKALGYQGYKTIELEQSLDLFELLNDVRIHGENNVLATNDIELRKKLNQLKYKLYCSKLPIGLQSYIRDNEISLDLGIQWISEIVNKVNSSEMENFKWLINTIIHDDRILIYNEAFNIELYLKVISEIIRFKEKFRENTQKPDNQPMVIMYNILEKYWRIQTSKIGTKIEIDEGILKNHLLLSKLELNAGLTEQEELDICRNILNIPENLRAKSTNILLSRISSEKKARFLK